MPTQHSSRAHAQFTLAPILHLFTAPGSINNVNVDTHSQGWLYSTGPQNPFRVEVCILLDQYRVKYRLQHKMFSTLQECRPWRFFDELGCAQKLCCSCCTIARWMPEDFFKQSSVTFEKSYMHSTFDILSAHMLKTCTHARAPACCGRLPDDPSMPTLVITFIVLMLKRFLAGC